MNLKNTYRCRRLNSLALILTIALTACGGGSADIQSTTSNLSPAPLTTTQAKVESFSGNRNQYQILQNANGVTVRDIVGTEGSREIVGATAIKFADLSVNLQIGEQAKTIPDDALKNIIELYIAFFNRVPDADGLAYWIKQYKDGTPINNIADSFYQAALSYSSSTGYTANQSNADFVKIIYKNVLGRTGLTEPPAQDVQYWVDQLVKGTASKSSLVASMLYSAHTFEGDAKFGWVPNLLNNKISTAKFFSIDQGISYLTQEESITKGVSIAAEVTPLSTNAAKTVIGISDFGFNLSGKNTLSDHLNSAGILINNQKEVFPLRINLQLDSTGKVSGATYDFRKMSGTMSNCPIGEVIATICLGTHGSFKSFTQAALFNLAGTNSKTVFNVGQDDNGYSFTGTITGVVWSGTWTKVAVANSNTSDAGTFSVVVNFKSPNNNSTTYNVQDLMLQFYSQHRLWNLNGTAKGVTFPIDGFFETIPYANEGGTFIFNNETLKQMDTRSAIYYPDTMIIPIIRHINYSPISAQIGLAIAPSGWEIFSGTRDADKQFPVKASMLDSGKNANSETRRNYPIDMSVTSITSYTWNLTQKDGRDLLCIVAEEILDNHKLRTTRCHQINPDGKLGEYMSLSTDDTLANGTSVSVFFLETK